MKKILLLCFTLMYFTSFSDESAISETGKKVLLKEDGTWVAMEVDNKSEYSFRKVNWGMTREQVKASEILQIEQETEKALVYVDTLLGYEMAVVYFFTDDILTGSKYLLLEDFTDDNRYITVYGVLKNTLSKKYGDGDEDTYWSNDLYQDDYDRWGFAVSLGHYSKYTEWKTENCKINQELTGNNYSINLSIFYTPIDENLTTLVEQKKDELIESKF